MRPTSWNRSATLPSAASGLLWPGKAPRLRQGLLTLKGDNRKRTNAMNKLDRSSSAFLFLLIAIVALSTLTACTTSTLPGVPSCPVPNGDLLVTPSRPEPIPETKPLELSELTRHYVEDLERGRMIEDRLSGLQAWGRDFCGWPVVK